MLYPIELLRHGSTTRNAVRWTASMLTATLAFVMSSLPFKCRQMVRRRRRAEGRPRKYSTIHPSRTCRPSKSAFCHYPIQNKDGRRFVAYRLSAQRYGTTTRCSGHNCGTCMFFQTSPHFLMKGTGITPLPGSEFVTELAPMIWQF